MPLHSAWRAALSLLVAIVAAAAYTSLINDVTDRHDDAAAGKRNRVAGRSPAKVAALIAVTAMAGLLFAWLWRGDARLLACYLGTWLAFSLYSLPPFRLKTRGVAGVLCDAAGAHLFPALMAVFAAGGSVSATWIASVAAWSFAYGMRGILWHQLDDAANDRAAGVGTFACRHPRAAAIAGTFVVFPLELIALAAMLWQIGSAWPASFLALYAIHAVLGARRWRTSPVIVVPKPRFFIVLHEFYSDLFPIALLIAAALRDRRDVAILAAHVALFPQRPLHLIQRAASAISRRLNASTANTVVNASEPHHGGVA